VKNLWRYFSQRKKFWLLPLLLVFAVVAVLIILGPTNPYSPFIYTVF
jgi:competence protein ComGC